MSLDFFKQKQTPIVADMPRHVAIIMDGNGRWAKARHLPRPFGHREGVKVVKQIITASRDCGIEALTLFAFSSENWRRPRKEVEMLMDLFISTLRKEIDELHKKQVRIHFIGERSQFSAKMRDMMDSTEQLTADNKGMHLTIAANYGGRWDILDATRKLVKKALDGEITMQGIDEEAFVAELSGPQLPEPDLFIRTGGEQRISNFLLWQLAYTELYFTDTLWPDFDEACFNDALISFAGRQRRFGQTGDQVESAKGA